MIFVTVGSQKFQFNRLLKAVDELVANGDIKEEVFAQIGKCTYIPKQFDSKPFIDRDEFTIIMEQSDLIITHGGTGTIISALKAGKKVLAVPRLAKYHEHVDDHQLQIIEQFTESNLICSCTDLKFLNESIMKAKAQKCSKYCSNTEKYLNALEQYIDET